MIRPRPSAPGADHVFTWSAPSAPSTHPGAWHRSPRRCSVSSATKGTFARTPRSPTSNTSGRHTFKVAKCDLREPYASHRLGLRKGHQGPRNAASIGILISARSHPIYALGFEWTTVMVGPYVAAPIGTKG